MTRWQQWDIDKYVFLYLGVCSDWVRVTMTYSTHRVIRLEGAVSNEKTPHTVIVTLSHSLHTCLCSKYFENLHSSWDNTIYSLLLLCVVFDILVRSSSSPSSSSQSLYVEKSTLQLR
jgi:hypothetical protein